MTPVGASVAAIDHDRLFKELLEKFFLEFLQLFFPKLAALIDPDSIESYRRNSSPTVWTVANTGWT